WRTARGAGGAWAAQESGPRGFGPPATHKPPAISGDGRSWVLGDPEARLAGLATTYRIALEGFEVVPAAPDAE
ncbi:MAG: hypothetical protein ACREID_09720, partial [Planctomycetota bacterium]